MTRILQKNRFRRGAGLLVCLAVGLAVTDGVDAQSLRFTSGYGDIAPPADASFRIGPFYSSLRFTQSIGYRYSASATNIVDVIDGTTLGEIKADGSEFPMVSTLSLNNYMVISKNADLNASVSARYEYYPLDTQESQFVLGLTEEQILADFTYAIGYQARLSEYLRGKLYVRPSYMTAYVDPTGREDRYGGRRYERFANLAGAQMDYLMKKDMNLALTAQRQDTVPLEGAFESQRSTQYSAAAAWEYQLNPMLMVGLGSTYATADYPESDSPTYDQIGASAFSGFDLTKSIHGSASLGYSVARAASASSVSGEEEYGTIIAALGLDNELELTKDLKHSIAYSRKQSRGFERGIEVTDHYGYRITWQKYSGSLALNTAYDKASVVGGNVSDYSDAQAGLNGTLLISRNVQFSASSIYGVRDNGTVLVEGTLDPAVSSDYSTWANQADVTWQFIKDVGLRVYTTWTERYSDNPGLEYARWTVGVDCMYSYGYDF